MLAPALMSTPAQWLTVLADLTTVVGVGAAVYALFEMKRQRNAAYRPQLIIEGGWAELIGEQSVRGPQTYFQWHPAHDDGTPYTRAERRSIHSTLEFDLPFRNLGIGSATHVQVSFEFDAEGVVHELQQAIALLPVAEQFPVEIKDGLLFINGKHHIVHEFPSFFGPLQPEHPENWPSMVPVGLEASPYGLKLPPHYLAALSTLLSVRPQPVTNTPVPLPSLRCTLQYTDIAENLFKRTCTIQPIERYRGWNSIFLMLLVK